MFSYNKLAEFASALGDPVRIKMIMSLRQDGQLSAGDLANIGNIAPSTASEHLARLTACDLLKQTKNGRHRYFQIAAPELFDILDSLEALERKSDTNNTQVPAAVVHKRLCLDHLGGRLGCGVTDALFETDRLRHSRRGIVLTTEGQKWLASFGVNVAPMMAAPRNIAVLCPDWSENRHHIGGAVGAAILSVCKGMDWLRTSRGNAAVEITPKGYAALRRELGLDMRAVTD